MATALWLAAPAVWAAPPSGPAPQASAPSSTATPTDISASVDTAISLWNQGEWMQARQTLEPLVEDPDTIGDVLERERALRYLADATLLDESLTVEQREELATRYISALLDADENWAPPAGRHSARLGELTEEIRKARAAEKAAACDAELVACKADYENEKLLRGRDQATIAAKDQELGKQKVLVQDKIQNNRAIALIPFGVGHFYNRRPGLGAGFLAAEVAFGGAGLGLLLWRRFAINCRRTAGFTEGSLVCEGKENETVGVRARNAEQVMGYLTLGAFVTDIIVAQILFEDITVVDRGLETRDQIDDKSVEQIDADSRAERKAQERGDPAQSRLQWRPSTLYMRRGAGVGLRMRF